MGYRCYSINEVLAILKGIKKDYDDTIDKLIEKVIEIDEDIYSPEQLACLIAGQGAATMSALKAATVAFGLNGEIQ